jgi:DNA modification methylase
VLALTNPDDWILDPFAGVGSTVIAAVKNERNAVGIEKEKKYRDIGISRMKRLKLEDLKFRPLGKPIYDHTLSKLSILPDQNENK